MECEWDLLGQHNQYNALNAIAATRHAGVTPAQAIAALNAFSGVKRRLEVIYQSASCTIYDDFAHHPTAIRTTLEGLRKAVGNEDILAVIEPRTHTMSLGTLRHELSTCIAASDEVMWFRGENIKWDLNEVSQSCVVPASVHNQHDKLIEAIVKQAVAQRDKPLHIVIMSNGGFGDIYRKLTDILNTSSL